MLTEDISFMDYINWTKAATNMNCVQNQIFFTKRIFVLFESLGKIYFGLDLK